MRVEMTAIAVVTMMMGAAGSVAAQELPTTPVAICAKEGDGRGAFTAETKSGDPRTTRRLQADGTLASVAEREVAVLDLQQLSERYVGGDWVGANGKAVDLLNRVTTCLASEQRRPPGVPGARTAIFDLKKDYVHLLWVSTLPAAAEPAVFSMLVHEPRLPEYSRVLPGLSDDKAPKVFEVFLSENLDAKIASYYVSRPLPDPLLDQVPQVVEKFLGPLFTLFDRVEPAAVLFTEPSVPTETRQIHFEVRQVKLPEPRAGIEVTMRAGLPITRSQMVGELTGLAIGLDVKGLSRPFAAVTQATFKDLLTLTGDVTHKDCGTGSAATCKAALHETITRAFETERSQAPTDPRRRELDRLEAAFHTFVDGLRPGAVTGKAALDNSPLTHFTFGAISSYAFHVRGTDLRAKVENGKVVNAPLPRALQIVALNYSPWGYQSKTNRRWIPKAAAQPFVGVIFSPDLGIAVGGLFRFMANLGVNFGYGRMLITRPEDGLVFGAVLDEKLKDENGKETATFRYSDALRRDPLRHGKLHTVFLGVSYNFK